MNVGPLLNINDRLTSSKSLIIYQKQEMFKAKASLAELQNHLIRQNEELNECMEEERELQAEITRRNLFVKKEEQPKGADHVVREKLERQTDCTIECVSSSRRCKITLNQLDISELRNKTINTIYYEGETDDIYIGGSEGTLLRHNSVGTRVYDTDLEGDILHIKVTGRLASNEEKCLIAVARNKLYVYDIDKSKPLHVLEIEEIKSVHFNVNNVFITYTNGGIEKFTTSTREVTRETLHSNYSADFYIPSDTSRRYGAIVPQNSSLYIKTSPGSRRIIGHDKVDLMTNIKGFMAKAKTCLCHSDNKLWVLTRCYNVSDELDVVNGVKCMDLFYNIVAIVDLANTLGIFYLDGRNLLKILYKETFEREVTAVFVSKYRVTVAVGDIVVFVECENDDELKSVANQDDANK